MQPKKIAETDERKRQRINECPAGQTTSQFWEKTELFYGNPTLPQQQAAVHAAMTIMRLQSPPQTWNQKNRKFRGKQRADAAVRKFQLDAYSELTT